jgi:hypothetical protein
MSLDGKCSFKFTPYKTEFILAMKKAILFTVLLLPLVLKAQEIVQIKGTVMGLTGKSAFVSVVTATDHKLYNIAPNGSYNCMVKPFTEYVLAFYAQGNHPQLFSINTDNAPKTVLEVNLQLATGKPEKQQLMMVAPTGRYYYAAGGFKNSVFDLDQVRDKMNFGQAIAKAFQVINQFYETGKVETNKANVSAFDIPVATKGKTEHELGDEIAALLVRKEQLEQNKISLATSLKDYLTGQTSANEQEQECIRQADLLKNNTSIANIQVDIAQRRVQQMELRIKRTTSADEQTGLAKELYKLKDKLEAAQTNREIATLEYENKTADCQLSKLLTTIETQKNQESAMRKSDTEIATLELEADNLRLKKWHDNSRALAEKYNKAANYVTGRERKVQLAVAQHYVAQEMEARLRLAENKLGNLRSTKNAQNQSLITAVEKEVESLRQRAYQARMGYEEHMWHLRDEADMNPDIVNKVFVDNSKLLTLNPIVRPEPEVVATTPDTESASTSNILTFEELEAMTDDEIIAAAVAINDEEEPAKGTTRTVKIMGESYEIVVNTKGEKKYFKNNKPVTALTYRFETVRKFGQFLENIRYEDRKVRLIDKFRIKTEN